MAPVSTTASSDEESEGPPGDANQFNLLSLQHCAGAFATAAWARDAMGHRTRLHELITSVVPTFLCHTQVSNIHKTSMEICV